MIAIARRVLDDVRAHAREEAPRECCGILVGRDGQILAHARARNLAAGTTRFELDPADHIRAMRAARQQQMDIVGFYHSHPRSPAYPSPTDVAECGYAGMMHLIAGVGEQGEELRLFTIVEARVTELVFSELLIANRQLLI
ncbi:MAG: M67 family metallopeptidase [Vicinamibacterales bacterium]